VCCVAGVVGATGTAGPNLDQELPGKPKAFIRQSIVDPSAHIADGFSDIMPKDFGTKIPPDQLDQLVALLAGAQQ